MITMTSQITSLTIVYSTVYSGADKRKHQSSASLALCGKFTGTGEFPAQRASNAENVSIWWRHQDFTIFPRWDLVGNYQNVWYNECRTCIISPNSPSCPKAIGLNKWLIIFTCCLHRHLSLHVQVCGRPDYGVVYDMLYCILWYERLLEVNMDDNSLHAKCYVLLHVEYCKNIKMRLKLRLSLSCSIAFVMINIKSLFNTLLANWAWNWAYPQYSLISNFKLAV